MRINIVRNLCVAVWCFGLSSVFAAPVIPTAPGTSWRYNMTEEIGKGLNLSNLKADADGKIRLPVWTASKERRTLTGKIFSSLKCTGGYDHQHRSAHGGRTRDHLLGSMNLDGEFVKFSPPQTMIVAPLKKGAAWDFDGQAGDLKVQQHYDVLGEEKIDVPAGNFQAFRIHGEQTMPNRMLIDRRFVPGVGIVKDITTMQGAKGDLLQRISLESAEVPKIVERPEVKSGAAPKRLAVSLAKDRFGKPTTTFSSNTPEIYARWQGQRLRQGANVKAVWIAENIGEDFPQDYKVDEASVVAASPTTRGAFTLARPEEGWMPGDYRVEFYVDDVLIDAVKMKIVQ